MQMRTKAYVGEGWGHMKAYVRTYVCEKCSEAFSRTLTGNK